MTTGIVRIGAYIPYYSITREVIAAAWDARPSPGERSLCNADEDSVTMAGEAAVNLLRGVERDTVDGLYFASTTAPYVEKSHATLLAKVCDLADTVDVSDFANCTRAATQAVRAAFNAVEASSARSVLVTAADARNGYPKSAQEQMFGDAGAAVLIGDTDVVAEIVASVSVNNEITDLWRNREDDFVRSGEGRFIKGHGYTSSLIGAVKALVAKAGISLDDVTTFVLPTPGLKDHLGVAKALKVPAEKVQDPLMTLVGDCGTAQPLLLLAAALGTASAGDLIVWTSYGNGADALLLRVTDRIADLANRDQIGHLLASRRQLAGYPRFLSFRGLLEAQPGEPYKITPSTTVYWRDRNSILALHGGTCRKCGLTTFPINRICFDCHSKDEYDEVRLYDQPFSLFTYSVDQLAGRSDDPMIGQAVAEAPDGTRIYLLITDFRSEDIAIGMPLEATFRKMHELGDFKNYYWKLRPVRTGRGA
ncbi:MAG: hypothetical protein KJ548_09130 [Actinobacteria bacterium]|nr:hypothetical protein [Actinomycetota bacterium]MCG2799005.1 hypothetical protein [Cellulomonas sp.]